MKDLNQLPDDIFRSGFSQHEAAFDPAAWEHMQTLLDKEDDLKPVILIPENTGKKRKHLILLIITIMSILTLLTLASTLLVNNHTAIASKKSVADPASIHQADNNAFNDKTEESSALVTPKTITNKTASKATVKKAVITTTSSGSTKKQASTPSNLETETTNSTVSDNEPIKPVKPSVDSFITATKNGKMYKVLTRTTWVPEQYDWVADNSNKTITDGFIGMHFTAQKDRGGDSSSAGFNFQIMSGNRIYSENWGLYGGFDWGMQFYEKGRKSNVALNNTRGDSGFSRLRSHSMDFLGRGHLEYAKYALIPYFNVMAGPRIYATNQQVESYVTLKETESGSSNNVHTSVSMLYGFGAGLRLRISPTISLDARYEWVNGSKVKRVDLNNSTFNGLSHDLKYYTSSPRQDQFKFGILIDLSEPDYEKKIIKEGYYKVTTIDSLQIDPKDSNKVYLPCNCDPCPKNNSSNNDTYVYPREREYRQEDPSNERERNNSNSNSTGKSSGSKGEFPGIRPPAPKPVNPN